MEGEDGLEGWVRETELMYTVPVKMHTFPSAHCASRTWCSTRFWLVHRKIPSFHSISSLLLPTAVAATPGICSFLIKSLFLNAEGSYIVYIMKDGTDNARHTEAHYFFRCQWLAPFQSLPYCSWSQLGTIFLWPFSVPRKGRCLSNKHEKTSFLSQVHSWTGKGEPSHRSLESCSPFLR